MNLLEELKGQMSEQLLGSIAQGIGIEPDKIQSVLGSALPGILALLGKKTGDAGGAETIFSAIQDSDDGILSSLTNLADGDRDSLLSKGADLFGSLFGDADGDSSELLNLSLIHI